MSLPPKNWETGYVVRTLKSFVSQLGRDVSAITIVPCGEVVLVKMHRDFSWERGTFVGKSNE